MKTLKTFLPVIFYIYIYIYIYIYTHTHILVLTITHQAIYIYIYTHTHTHTHIYIYMILITQQVIFQTFHHHWVMYICNRNAHVFYLPFCISSYIHTFISVSFSVCLCVCVCVCAFFLYGRDDIFKKNIYITTCLKKTQHNKRNKL